MNERKKFYSVATLARLVGRTERAVELRLKRGDIEPDAQVLLPGGRRVALFEEKTLALLLDQKPHQKL